MFASVTSSSRATCPNTEMRRRDRRWDSEVRPVHCSTSSFRTRSYRQIPSSCLRHFWWKASRVFTSADCTMGRKNSITIRQTVGTIKPCLQHTNRELNSSTKHLYSNGNVHSASTEQVDPLNQELIGHAHSPACQCHNHGHRIDKYLDTLLANQTISDSEATDHCQKVTSQDGGLRKLIVARSCLTNHSKASRP